MIAKLLYDFSARLPCRLIQRNPGEPYVERYLLSKRPGRYRYLHRFVAADLDETLHDHPWDWAWSLVLTGGYQETWLDRIDPRSPDGAVTREVWRGPGSFHRIRGGDFHRITRCQPETWTIFCHGNWQPRSWGMLELAPAAEGVLARHHRWPATNPDEPWWEDRQKCARALALREPFGGAACQS